MTVPAAVDLSRGRHAGVLVPLAAMPSSRSWGIGEIPDIEPFGRWLRSAGMDVLQILPINEVAEGQSSPYSALSAMAIDPAYISLMDVEEFAEAGGEGALDAAARDQLVFVRAASRVEVDAVRALKRQALRMAFDRFHAGHWMRGTPRAVELGRYITHESWWLDDYARFRTIRDGMPEIERMWTRWPVELRDRDPMGLRTHGDAHAREVLFHQYVQWLAATQWARMRARAPVALFGDLPFMVALDSADVWARQREFRFDTTVGTPPDAFSADGQDWGLPAYRWDAVAANDFEWLSHRARRCAALFDGFRIDHVVGFYRTYNRPIDGGVPFFDPSDEPAQRILGERIVGLCRATGAFVSAEDLGTIPDFVRASLVRLEVPGYRVFRWERAWDQPDGPFLDPAVYPARSIATSGTHDTTTLADWWEEIDESERIQVLRVAGPDAAGIGVRDRFSSALRDMLLQVLLRSGSDIVVLPVQDLFGWRDRINVPATVSPSNWTYRLPWPVNEFLRRDESRERADALRTWCERSNRCGDDRV